MKKLITPSYTFTPGLGGVGTIDLYGIKNFNVGKIYCLIHKPTGTIIYSLGILGLTYSAVSTTMVTLQANTSTYNANDKIDIIYDEDLQPVTSNVDIWRHGFGGNTLNTDYFEVLNTGAGQTVRVGQVKRECTFTRSTTTATVTAVAHGMVTGDLITILYTPDELAIIYSTVIITVTGVDTFTFTCLNAGVASGALTYGQDVSNLQLLSGITPNSETVIKSKKSFTGTLDFTFGLHMNQRIANTELIVGLYEINPNEVGIPCTISGQIATITEVGHGHLQGQEIQILTSTDGSIVPNSVRIISVPDNDTFTFACVGGVGASATITYFCYESAIQLKYDGTSVTNARFSTFRNVWDSPAPVTISTTAGLPNAYKIQIKRGNVTYGDYSPNSTSGTSVRAERNKEIPDVLNAEFYIFIRLKNLAVAPATSTTCTFSFFEVNQNGAIPVDFATNGLASFQSQVPVQVLVMPTTSVNPTDTQGGTFGKMIATGGTALSAWATTTTGKVSQMVVDLIGRQVGKPFAPTELCWNSPPLAGGIVNNAALVVVKESAGAGLRNYVNNVQIISSGLSASTELEIRDADVVASSQTIATNILTTGTHGLAIGELVHVTASGVTGLTAGNSYWVLTVPSTTTATFSATRGGSTLAISGTGVTATLHKVLWMGLIAANQSLNFNFDIPLKGSVATALSVQTKTAVTGAVYVNLNGHTAP